MTNLAIATAALAAATPGKTVTLLEHVTPAKPGLCGGAVVLRYNPNSHHPLMTHWRNDDLGGYHKGNYFGADEMAQAVGDFNERVRRER